VPLLDGVMQSVAAPNSDYESGIGQFAVSRLGTLVYAGGGVYPPPAGSMVRLDRSGAAVDLNFKDVAYGLRLSPDGRRLVATKRTTSSRSVNVELYDLERGTSTPLTSDGDSGWPIWSRDGQQVLFMTAAGSRIDSVAADGSGARETVFNKEGAGVTAASWSHDGRWLAILLVRMPSTQILVRPMTEKGEPWVFLESGSNTVTHHEIFDPEFSPDGKWIAYTSTETGALEVYVQAFPGPGEKHRISTVRGLNPTWSPSGRELFYLEPAKPGEPPRGSKMMAVDIDDRGSFRAGAPHELFTLKDAWHMATIPVRSYDVYPDGRHFIASFAEFQTDPQVARLNVVLNWFNELKRRIPAAK
jgi:eukaryotic-like serine/threonine-protein kinase